MTISRTDSMKSKNIWTLVLCSVGAFMVALDALIVATALNTIRLRLGAYYRGVEINSQRVRLGLCGLAHAGGGAWRPLWAPEDVRHWTVAIYPLASAACALSPGVGWLIAARAIQGCGAALVMPLALTLLSAAFPPEQRGPGARRFRWHCPARRSRWASRWRRHRPGHLLAVDLLAQCSHSACSSFRSCSAALRRVFDTHDARCGWPTACDGRGAGTRLGIGTREQRWLGEFSRSSHH